MSQKIILTAAGVFLVIVNTAYFWFWKTEYLSIPIWVFLSLYFLVLFVIFCRQLYLAFKEKFRSSRKLLLLVLAVVLGTTIVKPNGLIDFSRFERDVLLIAATKGVAGCGSVLKLKAGGDFVQTTVCFGAGEITGKYVVRKDSIFFTADHLSRSGYQVYPLGVVRSYKIKDSTCYDLDLYRSLADSIGYPARVLKNELVKN